MSEKELKKNIKLYPSYRAFAYDFLFLWTISILYLTEIKGLSYSQVIFLDSVFMIACFGLQIPITKMIKKIGRVPAARLASILWLAFAFIYLFGEGFAIFIIILELCIIIYFFITLRTCGFALQTHRFVRRI